MVAYVHIEYSTYQFSEESKGGGDRTGPPPSLRYRKKLGPERVNIILMVKKPLSKSDNFVYFAFYIHSIIGYKTTFSLDKSEQGIAFFALQD